MILIPIELLEQFERGNVLLFIGEQLLSDVAGRATIDELTAELVARTQIDHEEELDFPAIAQLYQDQQNRHALVQFVCERLEAPEHKPQPVHHLIAQLSACRIIVTTCLDQRLGEQEWHLEILQSQRQVLPAARARPGVLCRCGLAGELRCQDPWPAARHQRHAAGPDQLG